MSESTSTETLFPQKTFHKVLIAFVRKSVDRNFTKRMLWVLVLLMPISGFLHAQNITVRFTISDEEGHRLSNATIAINRSWLKTDSAGEAARALSPGKYYIQVSSVNHNPAGFQIQLDRDTTFNLLLKMRQSMLSQVMVFGSRQLNRNQMGVLTLSSNQLKKLPVLLGEIDPLKTLTLLPGIKNGGEASAGIYVRGGGPDQNLVLLDGIPVYNPNHLLGFFSIFNGEAIKQVDVIKGNMPAEYGGRLSSVITIDTRDGNTDSLCGSGGIGLIASRIRLEGPIQKKKSAFMLSARRTYVDQLAGLVAPGQIGENRYYFYDVNAGASFTLNERNKLRFTFYTGRDDFNFVNNNDGRTSSFNTLWGNTLAGLSWMQQITPRLRQQTTLAFNQFELDSRFGFGTVQFLFTSGLRDGQAKTDWQLDYNRWMKLKWGAQWIAHRFTPGAGGVTTGVQEFKSKLENRYAKEAAGYFSADIHITQTLNLIAGIRYSYFNQTGPTSFVEYGSDGVPTGNVQRYERGQSIAAYHNPEPRLNLLYRISEKTSLKAAYTRSAQYIHLATTSSATFPSDLWIPSSRDVKPALARQFALGYYHTPGNKGYELSVETYYKEMTNQIEFKPGARLLLNQNLEGEMIFGSGKAYGIEFLYQKRRGNLTGWIGYTLSRAERRFDQLNDGKSFAYRYDRTHDISVVANYTINKKWEASAVFVYGTGNALTLPSGRYTYNLGFDSEERRLIFTNINQYADINSYRMPANHRLDVAFTYTPKPESLKKFKSKWQFSLYNLYNRYNPFFIYFDVNEDEQTIQGKKVYLFPIVPGISWNFSF